MSRYILKGIDSKGAIDYNNFVIIDSFDDNLETSWYDLLEDISYGTDEDLSSNEKCEIGKEIVHEIFFKNIDDDICDLISEFL